MKRILCSDWLPEQERWTHLARSGFPVSVRQEKGLFFGHHIINPLVTKREVKTAGYCPRTYTLPMSSRLNRTNLVTVNNTYSWFATT